MEEEFELEEYFREMDDIFENFLGHLIELIKELYNNTLIGPVNESEGDRILRRTKFRLLRCS